MGEMQYVLKKIAELPFNGGLAFLLGERRTVCKIRMYDHLKAEHEDLIDETHRWFEYGKV
jgi:hypothetical protein